MTKVVEHLFLYVLDFLLSDHWPIPPSLFISLKSSLSCLRASQPKHSGEGLFAASKGNYIPSAHVLAPLMVSKCHRCRMSLPQHRRAPAGILYMWIGMQFPYSGLAWSAYSAELFLLHKTLQKAFELSREKVLHKMQRTVPLLKQRMGGNPSCPCQWKAAGRLIPNFNQKASLQALDSLPAPTPPCPQTLNTRHQLSPREGYEKLRSRMSKREG